MGKHGSWAGKVLACAAGWAACRESSALMAHGPLWSGHPSMAHAPSGAMLAIAAAGLIGSTICALAAGWNLYLSLSRPDAKRRAAMPWAAVAAGLACAMLAPLAAFALMGAGAGAVFGEIRPPMWTAEPRAWLGLVALASGFAGMLLGKSALDIRFDEGFWDAALLAKSAALGTVSAALFWALLAAR